MVMTINIFKDFLSREFGKARYSRYFAAVKSALEDKSYYARKKGSEELYQELFQELKDEEYDALLKRWEKLVDAMYAAVKIHRQYLLVVIVYVGSCLFLIGKQLVGSVTLVSLLLLSICFLYKTWEFVVNKFCYVDANIILVYKSVLDKIIEKRK